ncbi:lysophospholipase L1-like esterase [Streptosporangium becharense]|uniref:Lysophospholipase L1-like esterase n=1 Tax=Streptosporangium becharense TaxID=1816182 RepID=A0A7W9MEG5_9ACTN|nr:GDSL-type esterase/lipase family protein [Streptosporangium becharense]MBB2910756.1 lysophospholipase L1-like esterase [Streptosporangium becharense]MBB5817451.1 lysophospholipase L1-like esterase [Streptosporangium becharense]
MTTPRRILTLLAAATLTSVPATAVADAPPVPGSMASMGDSITRGFNACGFYLDCPSRSWSTGSSPTVNSHYLRTRGVNPSLVAHNDGKSGAKVADLPEQARKAVSQGVDYVTILVGANDACASSEAGMTTVADFEAGFRTAMRTLTTGLPGASIFVSSIPDIERLWEAGKDSSAARAAWSTLNICQSMLARPRSTDQADADRRDRVHRRVADFNAVLSRVCVEQVACRHDGGAVFNHPFELSHLSTWDYFHPNTAGQRLLAELTYPADLGL